MTASKSNPLVCIPPLMHIRNLHNWTLHSSKTWDARQSQVPQVQNSGTCPFFAACFVWLTNPLAFWWSDNNAEPAIRIKHRYVTFLTRTIPLRWLLSKFGQKSLQRIPCIREESSSLLVPTLARHLPGCLLVWLKTYLLARIILNIAHFSDYFAICTF